MEKQITKNEGKPRMLTIRQTSATGILSEGTLRRMLKEGNLPHIQVGNRVLINYDRLIAQLESL